MLGVLAFFGIFLAVSVIFGPMLIKKHVPEGTAFISGPVPLPVFLISGLLALVFFWISADINLGYSSSDNPLKVFFFATSAVLSAIYGRCALSRELTLGSYLGFIYTFIISVYAIWASLGPRIDKEFVGIPLLFFIIGMIWSFVDGFKKAKRGSYA